MGLYYVGTFYHYDAGTGGYDFAYLAYCMGSYSSAMIGLFYNNKLEE